MRCFILTIFLIVGVLGWVVSLPVIGYPTAYVASIILTHAEINACALIVAQRDYLREGRSLDSANQSLIVDMGTSPDIIDIADSYRRFDHIGIDTVYRSWVNRGTRLCVVKKITWQPIVAPVLHVREGYHVYRWNGSSALVKDGDPDPVFSCAEGYRPTGKGCEQWP